MKLKESVKFVLSCSFLVLSFLEGVSLTTISPSTDYDSLTTEASASTFSDTSAYYSPSISSTATSDTSAYYSPSISSTTTSDTSAYYSPSISSTATSDTSAYYSSSISSTATSDTSAYYSPSISSTATSDTSAYYSPSISSTATSDTSAYYSSSISPTTTSDTSSYYSSSISSTTTSASSTAPTTAVPTTAAPTTAAPTTAAPTTAAPTTTATQTCDASISVTTDTTPNWSTPNYPSNYDSSTTCNVAISATTGYAITMTFTAFSLESATYCNYDYLSIYDGSSSSSSLIGSYCGTSNPGSVTSSSNAVYLVFSSDASVVSTGIKIDFSLVDNSYPGCKSGYTTYTASATIQEFSPQLSTLGRYLSNTDEYFLVSNPGKDSLILQLSAMNVERATNCPYDRIVIYDGGCTSFSVLATHCGTFLARWELPNAEYLVHFHSDSSVERTGFTMQYFTGTAGTGAPTSTTTLAGAAVTELVGLVQNVLTNYTAENSPRRDLSVPISSTVNLALVGINDLDENEQVLTTTVAFDITWQDAYMEWPTAKGTGVSSLLIPQDDMWKPDITLMNGAERITQMGASFMFVQVINNGTCRWKPYQILKSACNTGMSKYPYDIQKCDVKFSTWSSSGSDVTTVIGTEGMQKHADFVDNTEWTLLDIAQSTETIDGKTIAVFTLTIQRNQAFVVFYIMVPVIMLSFLNVFTFALPVSSGEKSGFGMTVFLSFIVYLIVTFQKLPENSEALSLFAMYLLVNSLISAVTVMLSCLEIRMICLTTKHRPLGPCARKFSSFIARLQFKVMCISTQVKPIESGESEDDDDGDKDDDEAWPKFVSALDFTLFFVFSALTTIIMLFFMVYLAV